MTKYIRYIVIVALVLTAFVFISNILIDNPFSHRFVQKIINEELARETKIQLGFESLNLKLFPFSIQAFGVEIKSNEETPKTILYLSRVSASVSFFDILLAKRRINSLELNNLALSWPLPFDIEDLLQLEKKSTVAQKSNTKFSWPPRFESPLYKLRITNSKVYVEEKDKDNNSYIASAEGVNINLKIRSWDQISGSLDVQSLIAQKNNSALVDEGKLNIGYRYSKGYLSLDNVDLESKNINISGRTQGSFLSKILSPSEKVKRSKDPSKNIVDILSQSPRNVEGVKMSFPHKINGDMRFLGLILDIPDVDGEFAADGTVQLNLSLGDETNIEWLYEANVKSKNVVFFDFKLLQSQINLKINSEQIDFSHVDIIDGDQKLFTANGVLGFGPDIKYDFKLQPQNLRLSNLMKVLDVDFDIVDFQFDKKEISLFGTGDPFDMTIVGDPQLTLFSLPASKILPNQSSPTCNSKMKLKINSNALNFADTKLNCLPAYISDGVKATALDLSPIDLVGEIGFGKNPLKLSINSEKLNLRLLDFISQSRISGVADVQVSLSTNNKGTKVDTLFDVQDLNASGFDLGNVVGGVSLEDSVLSWFKINSIHKSRGNIELTQGRLYDFDSLKFKTNIRANNISPSQVEGLFLDKKSTKSNFSFGISEAVGTVEGELTKPLGWITSLKLIFNDIRTADSKIFDRVSMNFKSDDKNFNIQNIQLNGFKFLANGALQLNKSQSKAPNLSANMLAKLLVSLGAHVEDTIDFNLNISSSADQNDSQLNTEAFNNLSSLPVIGKYAAMIGLRSRVMGTAKMQGRVMSPKAEAQFSFLSPSILLTPISPFRAKIDILSDDLNIEISQNDNLKFNMLLDLDDSQFGYHWKLVANKFDLSWAVAKQMPPGSLKSFNTDFTWDMSGNLNNWWASNGEFRLNKVNLELIETLASEKGKLLLSQREPVIINIENKRWELDKPLNLTGPDLQLTVPVFANVLPEKLDISILAKLNANILSKLNKKVESAGGNLIAESRFFGSLDDLKYTSKLRCDNTSDLNISIAALRPRFESIRCDISLDNNGIYIDSFSAKKGDGSIKLSGWLPLDGSRVSRTGSEGVKIEFDRARFVFPVKYFKFFESTLSGDLLLTGVRKPYYLSGQIKVEQGQANRDFNIDQEVVNSIRQRSYQYRELNINPLFNLNIDIVADKSIRTRNKTLNTDLSTNLKIIGSSSSPVVNGQIMIHEGRFFYKRNFRLNVSYITFTDQSKNDPNIDILAHTDVAGRRIYLRIYGRLSNTVVELNAEPATREDGTPLSKLDLLVLLSTGQLPDKNEVVSQTGTAAQLEAMNFITDQFNKPLQRILDFSGQDFIREPTIKFEISKATGEVVPRLNLPVNVYDQIRFNLGVNSSGAWEVSSEYPINESISLTGSLEGVNDSRSGSVNNQINKEERDAAIDLKFRFNFK